MASERTWSSLGTEGEKKTSVERRWHRARIIEVDAEHRFAIPPSLRAENHMRRIQRRDDNDLYSLYSIIPSAFFIFSSVLQDRGLHVEATFFSIIFRNNFRLRSSSVSSQEIGDSFRSNDIGWPHHLATRSNFRFLFSKTFHFFLVNLRQDIR